MEQGAEPDLEAAVEMAVDVEDVGSEGGTNSGASDVLEDLAPPSRPCLYSRVLYRGFETYGVGGKIWNGSLGGATP